MRSFLLLAQMTLFFYLTVGAKTHIAPKNNAQTNEIKFQSLKIKKELSDKKISPLRKYTLAILAAREFNQMNRKNEALDFYQLAKEIKVDENKNEIQYYLTKKEKG